MIKGYILGIESLEEEQTVGPTVTPTSSSENEDVFKFPEGYALDLLMP